MAETTSFEQLLDTTGQIVYTNKGVSMMPLLREGRDLMVIRKKGPEGVKKYDAVLFRRPGHEGRGAYVLHRILRCNGDGTYWIVGDNCPDGETVREENILGVLEAIIRDGKRRLSVDQLNYRIYVQVWGARLGLRRFVRRCVYIAWRVKKKIFG